MRVTRTVDETRELLRRCRREGKTVGFVPTMGYLHEGHLTLVRRSVDENDVTVVSIFVNPSSSLRARTTKGIRETRSPTSRS